MFYPHPEFQQIDPKQEYHCFHEYFFFPWSRKARDMNNVTSWSHWGWAMGMWFCHYRFTNAVKANRGLDWWWNAATPWDQHGFANFSYGTNNANIFSQCAKNSVIEVRSDYPWAEGGRFNTINIDDVDYWVEVDVERYKWPQINEKAIKAKPEEEAIAKHIMTIMRDRDIVQLGIGYCPEERGIFASLSAEENLTILPTVGSGGMSVEELYAMFPNLAERRRSPGSRLSGGEQQMLAMARILRTGARLLLLDEITEGLAPVIVQALAKVVRTLKERGFTMILVEQNFRFVAPLAARHFLLERGRVVDVVARSELEGRMDSLQRFLGV